MVKAIFPGSFDPPTKGHLNLIERGSKLFDSIDVVISFNSDKNHFLSVEDRVKLMKESVEELGYKNINVVSWENLIVEYARKAGASVILRGLRALSDFGYEFELAMINKHLDQGIETIFLPTDPEFFVLRSAVVKEMYKYDGKLDDLIPAPVVEYLKNKRVENH